MAGLEEIKDAGKNIKENLDQNIIDKEEITSTQKDVDLLKQEKDKVQPQEKENKPKEKETTEEKVSTEALKIWNKYADDIKDAIIAYFKPEKENKDGKKIPDISKEGLSSELITSYIKTLTTLKRENITDKKDTKNTERNERIDVIIKALNGKKQDIIDTKTADEEKTLTDILGAEPTTERAKMLFENNETMWQNIFSHTKDGKIDLPDEKEKSNFNQILQLYS